MHGSNAQAAAQELLRIGCHAYSKFLRVSSSGCKILVLPNKAANAMADAVAAREVRERRLISFGPSPRRIARGGRPFIEYINPEFGPLHDPAFNGRRYVCVMWPGVRVRMLSITTTTTAPATRTL